MAEVWKPIPGYESLYEVSNLGRVRSLYRYKKILKPSPITSGYLTVELWKNKHRRRIGVHRLVAMCFCKNPDNKPFVNHLDESRDNNVASNLEWVTHIENCNYGTAIERRLKKVDYSSRKRRVPICQFNKDGELVSKWNSISECARHLGIHESGIRQVLHGSRKSCKGFLFREVI